MAPYDNIFFVSFGVFAIFTIPKIWLFYKKNSQNELNFLASKNAKTDIFVIFHTQKCLIFDIFHTQNCPIIDILDQFLSCSFSKITIIFDTFGFLVINTCFHVHLIGSFVFNV